MTLTSNQLQASIPALTIMQFEPGDISSSVNLFRGNLAFPLKLLTLPGRGESSVNVTLLYQSQTDPFVDEWNHTAPTDVAGLGWFLPLEAITTDPKGNGETADNSYYLIHQGQTIPLIPILQGWARTTVSNAVETALKEGRVPEELKAALSEGGWPLSADYRLSPGARDGSWDLHDDGARRSYRIRPQGDGTLTVESGGLSFDMAPCQYWQVTFYPDYQRWEVIQPTGVRFSYGGLSESGEPDPHWIRWGVRWGNWVGPSVKQEGWSHFATTWNLAYAEDTTGQHTFYRYQTTERLLADSTATASSGEVPTYTSDCVLSSISNDLGWSCEFSYQNKTYDTTSLEAPKEYLIPELDPTLPPETPTAWQSPLKTLYLDAIAIRNDQGQLQATVCFDYYPLTNLTVRDPSNLLAYGATYKRYLKSIREVPPNGESLPSIQFEYEWDLLRIKMELSRFG